MLTKIRQAFQPLNQSKFLMGITMLLLNVGSKYVEMGFSKTQEEALRNNLGRELLIFAIVFMGTHDIVISILMTSAFVILSDYLFNENSRFCIIPDELRRIAKEVDTNNDNEISAAEERKALEVLRKANAQKVEKQQEAFTRFMRRHNR